MGEDLTYTAVVTDTEFWESVGRILRRERIKQKIATTEVPKRRGPSQRTVDKIERGTPGEVSRLAAYARVLSLALVDVFSEALPSKRPEMSLELMTIVRAYQQCEDVEGRQLMVQFARRVLRETENRASDQ